MTAAVNVSHDPVLHDLDAAGVESGRRRPGPALDQLGDLLLAPAPVPPQGADDPGGERAVALRREIGVEGVRHAEPFADQGILPADDAQRVQVCLRASATRQRSRRRWVAGPAGGRAPSRPRGGHPWAGRDVPLDAAVGRVRRVAVMPARSSAAVLTQALWWSRLGRKTAGRRRPGRGLPPSGRRPGTHPSTSRRRRSTRLRGSQGVRRDGVDVVVEVVPAGQVACVHLESGLDRVDVCVLESRQQPAAVEVHDIG